MNMKKNTLLATMLVAMIIAALVGYLLAAFFLPPPDGAPPLPPPEEMQLMVTLKTMLSFVNLVLIVPLLIIYVKIYRDVQSKFTSGLIVVILVFALYALTSNPLIHILFGYYTSGLGPFAILPDAFTTIALVVLFNLSLE
jgi:small-conductance mechanosensitive channel